MSKTVILMVSLLMATTGRAQQRMPQPPQPTVPRADPVMVINTINAGEQKAYNWNASKVKMNISCDGCKGNKVNITWNKRAVLRHYSPSARGDKIATLLVNGSNVMFISAAKESRDTLFNVNIIMNDLSVSYNLNVQCSKKNKSKLTFTRLK
ncbi:MAG: hypothetical protein H7257_12865 [Taibaiella sp.]|nr:hypothetical protein [Taibaiella sp.]